MGSKSLSMMGRVTLHEYICKLSLGSLSTTSQSMIGRVHDLTNMSA